jgi:glyoxylase-like metal-dependent hydrolase (beta-lactamase superfamily II)
MPLTIRRFIGGPIETNAYLITDTSSGDAIVIDAPAGVTPAIVDTANSLGATVHQIVVTHGHWDHIQDLKAMSEALDAPIYGHPELRPRIESPSSATSPEPILPVTMDGELSEGDSVTVGGHAFTVMHMPGHDPAHIILYSEGDGLIFGGDVLFPGGHGRTDLPGADQSTMNRTLRRFLALPEEVRIFPGHGDETSLAAEFGWIRQISNDKPFS